MSLECKKLGFYYEKNKWIFRNVNLTINSGEVVGISGYSGCGKTTFAKVLANYVQPCEGEILIDGEKKQNKGFQKVQLILQHPEKAMNPKWKMERIINESYSPDKELLDDFGIKHEWMNRWPIELSGGELQRFSIVRSLNANTKYIIADEMTTMLDGITQAKIWNKLLQVCKKRDIGIVVVSHEKNILNKICDSIYYMDQLNKDKNNINCCHEV
ncbi:peptide/nickel transport system ATP-binding protein [Tissierella praeacuta DSM 18095]|uniref:Peptide/nickel transport system ATP-binding protein n=1 Tax=Tissierella praeacuta DSM 18095 TaxID=1123404 RepID=A0A1M4W9K3_9FIRM|nr:ATP-binding cassette domain-containing protein [Tissierella praeacuta]TCU75537.1 peptide/nickel transport system ATP-binding protein [Tissierella praeacuta]SHE77887.1 peptide/nickel transport system ATP-binding protein [Tissierella praeacuta DSM 18095]SUO99944.1 Methionine import ATP-binding protein MetN 2 [Tissierella praeacuta]